ncbi:MAG TPA: HEAT repeat domain-containing protein [Chloroflexia bacterium]|nr:HEAT repeat domain-containing protein [Chloroflexia bacterium]
MTSFREQIEKLSEGGKPSVASLKFLSDLGSEDRATLHEVWPTIPAKIRLRVVSALITIAEDNIDYDFRRVFLNALEDTEADVRREAIEGLIEDHSTLLMGRLLTILRNDPEDSVREAAAIALGRFTYLAQCNKLGIPTEAGRLRDTLLASARDRNEDEEIRRRAVESLGFYHRDKDVQELIADQYKRRDEFAESAVLAMGRTMDPEWKPIVMHELNSEQPAMRYEAAHAAGEMVLKEATPRLVDLIDDDDTEVRLMAIWALGQIGGAPASRALTENLQSDDPAIREAAQEALQEIAFAADPLNVI